MIPQELGTIIEKSVAELCAAQNTNTPAIADLSEHEADAVMNFYGHMYETSKQHRLNERRFTVYIFKDRRQVRPNA